MECPEDNRVKNKLRMRAQRGFKGLDNQTAPHSIKGRNSERLVAAFLAAHGYTKVELLGGPYQPDITFVEDGITRTVEVKTAICPRGSTSWYIESVSPRRLDDDFLAIVLPGDTILLYPMKEHLRFCSSSGRRPVTELVKQYAPTAHAANLLVPIPRQPRRFA